MTCVEDAVFSVTLIGRVGQPLVFNHLVPGRLSPRTDACTDCASIVPMRGCSLGLHAHLRLY